jgi:hypothetical protein
MCPDSAHWLNPATAELLYVHYLIELATLEKTLLALDPISRMVPTTITRITANITAYSAMSCPSSSRHILHRKFVIYPPKPNSRQTVESQAGLCKIFSAPKRLKVNESIGFFPLGTAKSWFLPL